MNKREIEDWCESNLFGERVFNGVHLQLTPTQRGIKAVAVEIIQKWEARKK